MVWVKPVKTLGGKTFWQDVYTNDFFKLQKHSAEGTHHANFISGIRSIWGSDKLFRIILSHSPYHCVAEGETFEEVNYHWNSEIKQIVNILHNKRAWYNYILFLVTENLKLLNSDPQSFIQMLKDQNSDSINDLGVDQNNHDKNNNNNNNNNIISNHQNEDNQNIPNNEKINPIQVDQKTLRPEDECKVCFENEICTVFVNCGHQVLCEDCANEVTSCPICRAPKGANGIRITRKI